MRYFVQLSYKGTDFHGWQRQTNGNSVQAELEKAFSAILRQPISLLGSGRTDTGVHAEQQFAHFEVMEPLEITGKLLHALNSMTPFGIAIQTIFPVRDDDHARFTAVSRYYQYRITRHKNPFLTLQSYLFRPALDVDRMNEAAALLLQHTNFKSFSKLRANVSHFHCTITRAEWTVEPDGLTFHIKANRFLWGMVRCLVGTLLEVGQGRMTVDEFEQIIQAQDRTAAGRAAPASGLFLVEVGYPADVFANRVFLE